MISFSMRPCAANGYTIEVEDAPVGTLLRELEAPFFWCWELWATDDRAQSTGRAHLLSKASDQVANALQEVPHADHT